MTLRDRTATPTSVGGEHTERVCVTCENPVENAGGRRYRHTDPDLDILHRAQPKLAHPMDLDPFAGADLGGAA